MHTDTHMHTHTHTNLDFKEACLICNFEVSVRWLKHHGYFMNLLKLWLHVPMAEVTESEIQIDAGFDVGFNSMKANMFNSVVLNTASYIDSAVSASFFWHV